MDIVEISNLFNHIAEEHPNLASYHFGWASDINRNVQTNFDPTQQTGTLYPLAHWAAPVEADLDLVRGSEGIEIRLDFYDLMLRDSSGNTTTDTMIEHWRDLRLWAFQFARAINNAGLVLAPLNKGIQIRGSRVRWSSDAHAHNDNLIMVSLTFTLDTITPCRDLKIDFTAPPAGYSWPPSSDDIENTFS